MTETIQNEEQESLNQVWVQLGREHRAGVIQLMAQLVFKRIVTQIENSRKEAHDGQNPG